MIEETIQKLTASIEALTAQLINYNTIAERCVKTMHMTRLAVEATLPNPEAKPYDMSLDSTKKDIAATEASKPEATPEAEAPKPKKAKKPTLVEAPLDTAAAPQPAPEHAAPTPPPEPKLPEQKDVIDIAGQLLVATNQNDGGFLKALAKELGLDKLRNAKPEQRQAVIDRITTEIARVKESAGAV